MKRRARTPTAKANKREAILNAALDEFFRKGFSAARMEDIAALAGVSKGSVYLYFESKDKLFEALIKSITAPRLDEIETISRMAPSFEDAVNKIAELAPDMIVRSDLDRLMKVLIGDSHNFPELVRTFRTEILDRVLSAFTDLLTRYQQKGQIQVEDPKLAARLVVAPIAMSGIWNAVFGGDEDASIDLSKLFRMHADALISAFAVKSSRMKVGTMSEDFIS
jgi:AcrR family transcriptional regulator